MTTQLERIEYELKKAGFKLEEIDNITNEEDYVQMVGNSVWKVCKEFYNHGHSGMSAQMALEMLKVLLIDGKTLTPLTNDTNEWVEIRESLWQSKRIFSCFSDDGLKTYYDNDDDENREWEVDDLGVKTGWYSLKPIDKRKRLELEKA